MQSRAASLIRDGYGVLLYDARGCGESEGTHISFGVLERHDFIAAFKWLRSRDPQTSISAIGWSQGAATILLAAEDLSDLNGIVLESAYDDLRKTLKRRCQTHLGFYVPGIDAPAWLFLKYFAGIQRQSTRPVDAISLLDTPVLVIAGEQEQRVPKEDTMHLFHSAKEPKALWLVSGAVHEDLYEKNRADYERRVLEFLTRL